MPQEHGGRRRLRVAMPMLTLVPGGMGGSETYARELTRELQEHDDLDVLVSVSAAAAGFSQGLREQVVEHIRGGASTRDRLTSQLKASLLSPRLRRQLQRADVVHFPLSVPAPRAPRDVPFVQTLLDVQHHDLAELFTRSERLYRSVTYDRPARRADGVITISHFSKARIVHHLGVPADRVHVVHLGVDTTRFTPNRGAREPFVLYPARGWAHKNHAGLLAAMELVRREEPAMRLVLTGGALDRLGDLPDWVDRRGLVDREELLELYRRAGCLAFPSRYEGFGLPPLEAMASGCPVAAADAGSLPEVCGDAAVLFDPDDPAAVARAVLTAYRSGDRLVERGLARADSFTWRRCAQEHAAVYAAVARRPGA